jgi:hypothetical protein
MHPDPASPWPAAYEAERRLAGSPDAPAPTPAPRGGTIGPPPPLPNNGWQMTLQAFANAAMQLAQAAVNLQPVLGPMAAGARQLSLDPVNGPIFAAYLQADLVASNPSLALVAWPYTAQGPTSPWQPAA